ncbi:MAG: hypothetical protein EZS28_042067, partial [Streblomastix strix]
MRLQTKGEEFSIDIPSYELELNNKLILTQIQQSIAKIHVRNKRRRGNSNRRSQSIVLKKIREEQFETTIIAPLWPGQIWYTEL